MENKAIRNLSRDELITDFVKSNPDYYIKEFKKIGSKPTYSFSFNQLQTETKSLRLISSQITI